MSALPMLTADPLTTNRLLSSPGQPLAVSSVNVGLGVPLDTLAVRVPTGVSWLPACAVKIDGFRETELICGVPDTIKGVVATMELVDDPGEV